MPHPQSIIGNAEMSGQTLTRRRGIRLKQCLGLPYGRHSLPLVKCCIRKIVCKEADVVGIPSEAERGATAWEFAWESAFAGIAWWDVEKIGSNCLTRSKEGSNVFRSDRLTASR